MKELIHHRLDRFLDLVGDRTPTPGGGSVSGLVGALACALGRMVAAYSLGAKTDPAAADRITKAAIRLHRAEQILRVLVTQDAVAFSEMAAAGSTGMNPPASPAASACAAQAGSAPGECGDAVLAAVAVPMEVAAVTSRALATLDELKNAANRRLLSDLGIAAVLAEAAARAARYTVLTNLPAVRDATTRSKLRKEMGAMVEHCADRGRSLETFVGQRLEDGSAVSR